MSRFGVRRRAAEEKPLAPTVRPTPEIVAETAPVLEGADEHLTRFYHAIVEAKNPDARDLAVASLRGELRTRRLNVADTAIIVRRD